MLFDLRRVLFADELFPAPAGTLRGAFESAVPVREGWITSPKVTENQVLLFDVLCQDDHVGDSVRQFPTLER